MDDAPASAAKTVFDTISHMLEEVATVRTMNHLAGDFTELVQAHLVTPEDDEESEKLRNYVRVNLIVMVAAFFLHLLKQRTAMSDAQLVELIRLAGEADLAHLQTAVNEKLF